MQSGLNHSSTFFIPVSLLELTLKTLIYCTCWVSFVTPGPIKPVKMPLCDLKKNCMNVNEEIAFAFIIVSEKLPKGIGFI